MTSKSKPPAEPVGIELLLELLNASEGLVDRNAPPPDVPDDPPEVTSPAQPESLPLVVELPPVAENTSSMEGSGPPSELADDLEVPADIADVAGAVDTTEDPENRFAAHVVRGMSKSKSDDDRSFNRKALRDQA
jgi:hypothetical protein